MERKKFLALFGTMLTGSAFAPIILSKIDKALTECGDPLTPDLPEGPFYKDEKLNRMDIAEGKAGVPITYVFKVEDIHCKPVENAIVDIWQCDKDGHYSDFSREKTLNQTWLRGYQVTDKNGICTFKSVFPGWYNGRLTHVHGKLHLKGKTLITTNFFFPKNIEMAVYKNSLYTKGQNPTTIQDDIEIDGDKERFKTLQFSIEEKSNSYIAHYLIAIK